MHLPPGLADSPWLDIARDFRREVIDPLEPHKREWIEDHDARFPWEAVDEGARRGLKTMGIPTSHGGGGASKLEIALAIEELAAGDMGIAVIFDQCIKISSFLYNLANDDQRERFVTPFVEDPRYLLAIANNDPDHTTDRHLSKHLSQNQGLAIELSTTARQDGDDWVIDGAKLMPSLASTAKLAVVLAQTEPGKPIHEGTTYFLVPTDSPGVSTPKIWDKISQRLVDNATIAFDGVRVPATNMLGPRGSRPSSMPYTAGGNISAAATTLGSARGAYEAAVAYARERVQGGRPIIEHQAVGMALAQMATELEAARALVWRAAETYDAGDKGTILQQMAKWVAAETSVKVCVQAMDVVAHVGIMRDNVIQKHMRDCLSFQHSDGTQGSRLLLVAQQILEGKLPAQG